MTSLRDGRIVDLGDVALYLQVSGRPGPLVVFDAALGATSLAWSLVAPRVAAFARVCVYDRAGLGWSQPGPVPRTAGRAADELRRALDHVGEPPPFLLVGHSYGGLVMRLFAARHPGDTAGLVLVDPAHPEDWLAPAPKEQARIDKGVRLCRHAGLAARLGLARLISALVGAGAIGLARRTVNVVTAGRFADDLDFILTPFLKLPRHAQQEVRRFWTRPPFYAALGSQIAAMPDSAREVLDEAAAGYGSLPLTTISRADADTHTLVRQQAVASLASSGRHLRARRGGHWIPLDDPDVIVEAIRDMHEEVAGRLAGHGH